MRGVVLAGECGTLSLTMIFFGASELMTLPGRFAESCTAVMEVFPDTGFSRRGDFTVLLLPSVKLRETGIGGAVSLLLALRRGFASGRPGDGNKGTGFVMEEVAPSSSSGSFPRPLNLVRKSGKSSKGAGVCDSC